MPKQKAANDGRILVQMGQRGTVTLPKEIREGIDERGLFHVVRRPDGVIELRPQQIVDASQQWFWAERWQRMERDADADIAAGRVATFADVEQFLADLES